MNETTGAGFGGIDIQRTPMGIRIVLVVERPGLVIGRKGDKIRDLTNKLVEKYGMDNPQIEVKAVGNPYLNAKIMANKLAAALERGWHFRRAGHSILRRIEEAGAKGAQIRISGKLTGDRSRIGKYSFGTIMYCGKPAESVDVGFSIAKTKPGVIGVVVKILPPDVRLPDEVIYRDVPVETAGQSSNAPEPDVAPANDAVPETVKDEVKEVNSDAGTEGNGDSETKS